MTGEFDLPYRCCRLHKLLTKSSYSFFTSVNSLQSCPLSANNYGDLMGTTKHSKLLILGSGPAGYTRCCLRGARQPATCADYRHGKGGQLTTTTEVENWPGDPNDLTGPLLMERMHEHATKFETEIILIISTRWICKTVRSV
ncbi:thioredoxin reductase [Escherichia coli]|uniref:Thioredoxin reductase n=1 Tax=Escherichia coli TaxID=562 RepID=A0A376UDS8_ECOLX|nr:thioredoxin reductase [Escherichia coli]